MKKTLELKKRTKLLVIEVDMDLYSLMEQMAAFDDITTSEEAVKLINERTRDKNTD